MLDELDAQSNNADRWEAYYAAGEAPWDKGEPSPSVAELLRDERIHGRVLVPGCGRGHDAVAIARAGFDVLAVDLSESGIADARRLYPDVAEIFAVADVFEIDETFDCVFEHTCFCAVHPAHRVDYVDAMQRVLQPAGRFLGVLYTTEEANEIPGPPYRVPRDRILDYFTPRFDVVWSRAPANSFSSRKGNELLVELVPR